jgi:hypothetical protein
MLVAVPGADAVAVVRHDLFDVDRLLGSSLAWSLTTLGSAFVFALTVAVGGRLGADSRPGITGDSLATALALLPMHRRPNGMVGRVVDRDRYVVAARVERFVRDVQNSTAQPEQAEQLCQAVLADPASRLLLRPARPWTDGYVDLASVSSCWETHPPAASVGRERWRSRPG